MKNPKIIIWGYEIPNHTQHYLHWGWYNTFKFLGYDTYWFSDSFFPKDFNFTNCLFIAEGYADNNIPINSSSVYFVNFLVNPGKYKEKNARVIDVRLNVNQLNDCNYNYEINKKELITVGNCAYYDANTNDSFLSDKFKKGVSDYEALYLSWATHLLPHEINLDDAKIKRQNTIFWTGSIGESNFKEIELFKSVLSKENIGFSHRDPWRNPASWDELKVLTQQSFIAPDLRGSAFRREENGKPDTGANHKLIGYIPCRIFKNISFGQLGITNSKHVYELFDGNLIFNDNEYDLFYDSLPHRENIKMIQDQMKYVKENHTFVDRVNSLLKIYFKEI